MISEGFLKVRESNRPSDDQIENKTLSEEARTQQKGVHNEVNKSLHIRNVTWTVENPRHFVDAHHQKPIPGGEGVGRCEWGMGRDVVTLSGVYL